MVSLNISQKNKLKNSNDDLDYSVDNLKAAEIEKEDDIITAKLYGDIDYSQETAILTEVEDDVSPKSNFKADRSPKKSDDVTKGYSPNSLWVDYSRDPVKVYRCISNEKENAEWIRVQVDVKLSYDVLEGWLKEREEYTTDDVSEGSDNLYFTTSRVDDHLSGGTGISYESGTISLDANIDNLNDVSSLSESNRDILIYNDSNGEYENRSLTEADISDLSHYTNSDVDSHLSGGTGISYESGTIENTDTGSDAVSSHESTYNHDNYLTNISSESIRDLSDIQDTAPSDGQALIWNDTESRYEPSTVSSDNYYLTDVSGDGNSSVTFTVSGADDVTQDFSHSHSESEISDLGDYIEDAPEDGKQYARKDATWTEVEGGGSGFPQIIPDNCSLDDSNSAANTGNTFGMVKTIDFESSEDGSIWTTFHFPSSLDDSKDINLDIIYNLSGSDDDKTVTIEIEYWVYGDGTTPSSSSPDGTNSDDISTGTGEEDSRRSFSLSSIPSSSLAAGNTITLKITRLGSSDDYSGTFQMLYIFPHQS